jgi:hypothetical protein
MRYNNKVKAPAQVGALMFLGVPSRKVRIFNGDNSSQIQSIPNGLLSRLPLN